MGHYPMNDRFYGRDKVRHFRNDFPYPREEALGQGDYLGEFRMDDGSGGKRRRFRALLNGHPSARQIQLPVNALVSGYRTSKA